MSGTKPVPFLGDPQWQFVPLLAAVHTNVELIQGRTGGAASPVSTLVCLGLGSRTAWPKQGSVEPHRQMPAGAMAWFATYVPCSEYA